MKVRFSLSNDLGIEFEASDHRTIFETLASLQEIFSNTHCGKCKSENVRYVVREVDNNFYYEIRCLDCRARLTFGCAKANRALFPHLKDKDTNKYLPNNGWTVYTPKATD